MRDGALLVARAAAVVRLLRAERPGFAIPPPASRWIFGDEAALMRFVRGTHPEDPAPATLPRLAAGSTGSLAAPRSPAASRATRPSKPHEPGGPVPEG